MSGYYKKSNGKVVELEQQVYSWLWSENIIELIIPDGCEYVSCEYNQLKELIIPDGCVYVNCRHNQLKELIIPNDCEWVWADMKSVTELNKVNNLYLYI